MHEPRGGARPPPLAFTESSEITAIDDKIGRAPVKQLVVASTKLIRDDEPTTLMVREEGKPKLDSTARGVGSASKTPAPALKEVSAGREAPSVADPPAVTHKVAAHRKPTPKGLVIAIVALLVVAAAAAGLYFTGYITI